MAAPPIKVVVPPAPPKKGKQNSFDRFVAAHQKLLGPYKTVIQQYAGEYGVPALWIAATLVFEGGNPSNPSLNKSGRGYGFAQIDPKTWFGKTFPPTGETITQQWASQPGNAINFMSWYLSTGISTYGSLENVYKNVYNPGYKGQANDPKGLGPASLLKGYPDSGITSVKGTPTEGAQGSAARGQAKLTNQADQNLKTQQALDPIYLAYTGKRATAAQVQAYIKNPVSSYQLEMQLSDPKNNPLLTKSPVWRTNAGRYAQYYRDVFGPNAKVPNSVIQFGIVNSLDETAFKGDLAHNQIKGQGQYEKSELYQSQFAQYKASYASIYGTPDQNGIHSIQMAINGGWTDQQWQNWLRRQPEYMNSAEYKTRAVNLAQRMGLLSEGEAQTVISQAVPQQTPGAPANTQPSPPTPVNPPVQPTKPKPAPVPAPPLVSEHGQGGGFK